MNAMVWDKANAPVDTTVDYDPFADGPLSRVAPTTEPQREVWLADRLGEDASLIGGLLRFTCPFDMTGSPTVTLPGGFAANGGPVGFQFVGRHFDEAGLVRAGDAFQRVTDWHKRHPGI